MATINVAQLSKSYDGVHRVLDDIDLEVQEGEFVGLLGPSGCGKSTLLRCVAGLDEPQRGRIDIGDRTVLDTDHRRFVPPEQRNIGMVFQNYALWPHLTVANNVAYPLRRRGVPRAEIGDRVEAALELVGLPGLGQRRPGQLSGGQQQRVAIARAVVGEPNVLLFDEPLSNLDANLRRLLRREIRALHERIGTTTLYVTHDQEEVGTLATRVVVLAQGRVAQSGAPSEVFNRPVSPRVAEFVGFDNFIPATVSRADDDGCVVATATHRIRAVGAGALAEGASVLLAVRSRALTVVAHDERPEPENTLGTGRIVSLAFLGDVVEVEVRLTGDVPVIAVLDAAAMAQLEREQEVVVAADENAVLAIADEASSLGPWRAEPVVSKG